MRFRQLPPIYLAQLVVAFLLVAFAAVDATSFAQTKKKTTRRKVTRKTTAATPAGPVAPVIARGTEMKIRLGSEIDTKKSQDGDRFTATVVDPSRFAEARVEGHIARVQQSGKLKGKTAVSLVFDRINFANGASSPLSAQVVRVYGEDSAKNVSEEGEISSGSKGKTTTTRTAGGAAAGAAIGAIAGGGKGAAIGALIGAAAGAGSTYIQGSNRIKLESGTEILIRTLR